MPLLNTKRIEPDERLEEFHLWAGLDTPPSRSAPRVWAFLFFLVWGLVALGLAAWWL